MNPVIIGVTAMLVFMNVAVMAVYAATSLGDESILNKKTYSNNILSSWDGSILCKKTDCNKILSSVPGSKLGNKTATNDTLSIGAWTKMFKIGK